MSDVGFYGMEAMLVAITMVVVAGIAMVVEGLLLQRRRRTCSRPRHVFLGPAIYVMLALLMLSIVDRGSLDWKARIDTLSWWIAAGGLVLWAVLRFRGARRRG